MGTAQPIDKALLEASRQILELKARVVELSQDLNRARRVGVVKSEKDAYEVLQEWLGVDKPLRLIAYIARCERIAEHVFRVHSSSGVGTYIVDTQNRTCQCLGFKAATGCAHLDSMRAFQRKFLLSETEFSTIVSDDEVPF